MDEDFSDTLLNWLFVRTKPTVVVNKGRDEEWTLASFEIYLLGLSFTITVFILVGCQVYSGCIDFICQPLFHILSVNPTPPACQQSQPDLSEPTVKAMAKGKFRTRTARNGKERKNVLFRPTRRVLSYVDTRSVFLMDGESDTPDVGMVTNLEDLCCGRMWLPEDVHGSRDHTMANTDVTLGWNPKLQGRGDYDTNEGSTFYDALLPLSQTGTPHSVLSNLYQVTESSAQERESSLATNIARPHSISFKSGEPSMSRSSIGMGSPCTSSTNPVSVSSKKKSNSGFGWHKRTRLSKTSKGIAVSKDTQYENRGSRLMRPSYTDAGSPSEYTSNEILHELMESRCYFNENGLWSESGGAGSSRIHGESVNTSMYSTWSGKVRSGEDTKRDRGKPLNDKQEKSLNVSKSLVRVVYANVPVKGLASSDSGIFQTNGLFTSNKIQMSKNFDDTGLGEERHGNGQKGRKRTREEKKDKKRSNIEQSMNKENLHRTTDLEFERRDEKKPTGRLLKVSKTSPFRSRFGKGKNMKVEKNENEKITTDPPIRRTGKMKLLMKHSMGKQLPPITSGHELQLGDTFNSLIHGIDEYGDVEKDSPENASKVTGQRGLKSYIKERPFGPSEDKFEIHLHVAKQKGRRFHQGQKARQGMNSSIYSENMKILGSDEDIQETTEQGKSHFHFGTKETMSSNSSGETTHVSLMNLQPTSKTQGDHRGTVRNIFEPKRFQFGKNLQTKAPDATSDYFSSIYNKDNTLSGNSFSNDIISPWAKSELPPKPSKTAQVFRRKKPSGNAFRDPHVNTQGSPMETKYNEQGMGKLGNLQRRHGNRSEQMLDTVDPIQTFLWGKGGNSFDEQAKYDQASKEKEQEKPQKPGNEVYNEPLTRSRGRYLSVKQNPNALIQLDGFSHPSKIPCRSPQWTFLSSRKDENSPTNHIVTSGRFGWFKPESENDRKTLTTNFKNRDSQIRTRETLDIRRFKTSTRSSLGSSQSSTGDEAENKKEERKKMGQGDGVKDVDKLANTDSSPPRPKPQRFSRFAKGDCLKGSTQQTPAAKEESKDPPTNALGLTNDKTDFRKKRKPITHTVPSHRVPKRKKQVCV